MSTMSGESLNLSPGPPPTYQVATESLCGPGSYVPEAQNSTPIQWSEMPALGEIPVTCLEPPTHNPPVYNPPVYNPPVYNQQKFNHPNIVNTNDIKRNYIDTSINNNRAINGIYLPNGVKVFNTNLLNGPPRPVLPNGAMMHGGNNWMTSTPNQNRLLNRPGWNAGKLLTSARKPKRIRTAFTSQQMMELEQEYARTRYLDRTRRIELADILHLNERTIKIWFQNRRMKEKKDKAESLEEEEASSTTDSSSDLNGVPIVIHDHEVYNRSMYVEQYAPATPSNVVISSAMPMHHPGQTSMINGYVPYMPENYEQCQPSHLHLQQQFPPACNSNIQEIIEDSPPSCEEVPNNSSNMTEQNWDLSWIKSININDDC